MKTWLIEPRDPIIVRDGRPFENSPGALARSLEFPFPSTTAGGVRTRHGRAKGGDFNEELIAEVKSKRVHGPLLVELDNHDAVADWLLPAPADALGIEIDPARRDVAHLRRLVPIETPKGAATNLPGDLSLVGAAQSAKGKPFGYAPRYWRWSNFQRWLLEPNDHDDVQLADWGHDGPAKESRTHVAIQPGALTAVEGALYQTRGLEFTHQTEAKKLSTSRRLALAVSTDAEVGEGMAPLGGERRLVFWREGKTPKVNLFTTPCPKKLVESILAQPQRACRLILLTPAHFTEGFRPDWLLEKAQPGVKARLRAAAVNRAQVVSGWDFDRRYNKGAGRPKPTRRLAPAGSVYFLELEGGDDEIKAWIEQVWMRCVSDDDPEGNPEQTRLDGFGLAALGVWSGKLEKMEVN